jgi:hypothetical protein
MNLFFIPSFLNTNDIVESPVYAKSMIPNWYKEIKPASEIFKENLNVKNCMPFFDSMSSGYIQKTWTDIHVNKNNDGTITIQSSSDIQMISSRNSVSIPIGNDFYQTEFIWQRQWTPKLPNGYSMLVTHPFNRVDLPFFTLSAIVDSDQYNHERVGNIPFYIKNGFTGVIPKGTPMFQILPFKREEWESVIVEYSDEDWQLKEKEKNKYSFGSYKKQFWQKKQYN